MAVYAYKGVLKTGKEVKGVRDSDSPKTLRMQLKREGVMVTEVMEESKAKVRDARNIDFGRFFRKVSTATLSLTTKQLATLLKSGVPLVESLGSLTEQFGPNDQHELKSALTTVRDKVNEGTSFADALAQHSKLFPPVYVSMVAAGEASGTLEVVLLRLSELLEAQASLKSKISSAIAYPIVMALMGVLSIAVMMTVTVPKVVSIFDNFGKSLPWYTQVVIFLSNTATSWWGLLIFVALGFGIWLFRRWIATPPGRLKWDQYKLRMPLFGKLMLMVAVARFARTLGTLLRSGVPMLQALDITRNVMGNVDLMNLIDETKEDIREGEGMAVSLKKKKKFPPIVTHMIAVGERSGQLEDMLDNIADAYDQQVDTNVQIMTSLLSPLLIIIMGGVTGFVAFSILMPLVQINDFF